MPHNNPAKEGGGIGLDGVDTVFIDTSALSELPSHLMNAQDLESLVGLNIQSTDLEGLQVSSESHVSDNSSILIHDALSVGNITGMSTEDGDMDMTDSISQTSQDMEVDSVHVNNQFISAGQDFLPITTTEEMIEQTNEELLNTKLDSGSVSFKQDKSISSESNSQHIVGNTAISSATQILKTSSGQFVILQPNQNSIGSKILTSGQILTSLSSENSGTTKSIFVNSNQFNSAIKQIGNTSESHTQFRSVQLKSPQLLTQMPNSGPVTKVILPGQPGVGLSQQLRLITSQANGHNTSKSIISSQASSSKVALQLQPVSLSFAPKNVQQTVLKSSINNGKSATKLKIPLSVNLKPGAQTTIPLTHITTLQNNQKQGVSELNRFKNPQKIFIKGPIQTSNSIQTTLKPGGTISSNQVGTQLIRIPVSHLSQLSNQGHNVQPTVNKVNFRLLPNNNNNKTFVSTNSTLKQATAIKTLNLGTSLTTTANKSSEKIETDPLLISTKPINRQAKQRLIIPISSHNQNTSSSTGLQVIRPQGSITLPASALPPGVLNAQPGSLVMIPAQYLQNTSNLGSSQVIQISNQSPPAVTLSSSVTPAPKPTPCTKTLIDANGIKARKPCNCTRSQCLKLYCDCFANGEFCNNCNCLNCYNNLEHEEDRQKAIKSCLERNPQAFRPKIGKGGNDSERRHNKGCNCKRSGCLKNYCECFEAKIPCSNMCKCIGCRNIDSGQPFQRTKLLHFVEDNESKGNKSTLLKNRHLSLVSLPSPVKMSFSSTTKNSLCRISQEVVEATCQCLLAQAEKSEKSNLPQDDIELCVINEFSRCLLQIIGAKSKNKGSFD